VAGDKHFRERRTSKELHAVLIERGRHHNQYRRVLRCSCATQLTRAMVCPVSSFLSVSQLAPLEFMLQTFPSTRSFHYPDCHPFKSSLRPGPNVEEQHEASLQHLGTLPSGFKSCMVPGDHKGTHTDRDRHTVDYAKYSAGSRHVVLGCTD